ncbi:histidine kinase response regulator hybrid protein [Xanthomarina gelatinilytica]|uniref:Histidine kinase response regulator hybrid protein n=1 Tax=Xanthomarina gelatinilytica TaxID=1137281 RepID=M7MG40_9FLAO|nr:response regulator [Xanthomarina gelatinilytica]EMQ95202.1 histidine kinase response regulator hybrid protein [Xanthomarina gelatinilytica]
MKTKAHILVVEDKALIYKRLKMILKEHHYSVDDYAPSVEEAIGNINKKRPDLVLLDIDLQGEHNGIYLGNLLKKEYNIPFIYVTDLDDDQTFYESLQTKHDDFIPKKNINLTEEEPIIIQTKPHLDEKRLIRSIQTVLTLNYKENNVPIKDKYILGYVDYVQEAKQLSKDKIQQKTVELNNVAYFTRNTTQIDESASTGKDYKEFVRLKNNYTRFLDWQNQSLYLPCNLKSLLPLLPYYFVQISEHMIVNIHPDELKGTINGSFFQLRDGEKYKISERFKPEVKKRIAHFYVTSESIKNK